MNLNNYSSTNNTDDEMEVENEKENKNNNNNLLKLHKFSSEELDFYRIQVDVMMLNAQNQLKFQRIIQCQKNEEELLKLNHTSSIDFYNQLSLINNDEKSNHQLLLDTLNIELLDLNYLKQLKKIYKKYTLEIKNFVDSQIIINQINNKNLTNK